MHGFYITSSRGFIVFNIYFMIKNEFIKLKVSSGLKQNYSNIGYDFSGEEVLFRISDLKIGSNQKIDVICDICDSEYILQYMKYIKNIKRNGLYSCKYCGLKKKSDIMKNNNISLNIDVKSKKIETFIKNYGVDNPSKSEYIKEKKRITCLKNYGVDNGLKIRDRVIKGMFYKYGVEHALQSDEIKFRMFSNLLNKYGVDNVSKLIEVKDKKEETCLNNYGVRSPSQNEDIAKRQSINYKKNYLKKYGVSHPMQRKEVFEKMLISSYKIVYYSDELFSQGSYELDFLIHCDKHEILNLISNGPSLKYKLKNKNHVYHSDFFIEKYNLIIEIKSSYTYNFDLEKNLAKEEYSKINGYDFLFIIDKNYKELNNFLDEKEKPA